MKTTLKKSVLLSLGLVLLTGGAGTLEQERAPEKSYVLADGTVHETPGEMFQYLRTRDNGLAAGNPSNIVDAYPGEAKNVGDMVRQKRVTE